jgi:hypothetical protein
MFDMHISFDPLELTYNVDDSAYIVRVVITIA